jgi:hypothetical protein
VVIVTCVLTSCATPGPGEYSDIAAHHAQQAQEHKALAQQHEAAARILANHGDTDGEEISQQAADEEARHARKEQFDADWDSWLSQWMPSPTHQNSGAAADNPGAAASPHTGFSSGITPSAGTASGTRDGTTDTGATSPGSGQPHR